MSELNEPQPVFKDIGAATAYAYAVAGGYQGTEEQFLNLVAHLQHYIGANGHWYEWDQTAGQQGTGAYVDTGIVAEAQDGTTFTPSVTEGVLSWTNTDGKPNPESSDIAEAVRAMYLVPISGTTPTIAMEGNHKYTCGELDTLTLTPPATGVAVVVFTSGATATVLTSTDITWPEWFDPDDLETDTVYMFSVSDGLGGVGKWPVTS